MEKLTPGGFAVHKRCYPCDECNAKLQAAEEMVGAIQDALANCETCRGEKGPRKCARCLTFIKLLAVWEKAGKGGE